MFYWGFVFNSLTAVGKRLFLKFAVLVLKLQYGEVGKQFVAMGSLMMPIALDKLL